jgi:hypothetical protein
MQTLCILHSTPAGGPVTNPVAVSPVCSVLVLLHWSVQVRVSELVMPVDRESHKNASLNFLAA